MIRYVVACVASCLALAHPALAAPLPVCQQAQLSLGFDSENGNFDGMSHSGTLLVLRNLGPTPCTLPAFPKLVFWTSGQQVLTIETRPQGTSPSPRLAVGAEATAALRWVSSPVFDDSACPRVTSLSVSWPGGQAAQGLVATICGPAGEPARVAQAPLATDPTLPD
ncbi:DUF4232 domain-containing protein [Acidocella sp.]|uniref:DUF4232 domain-containing protein n=1 Tax=Acidocella sp. TaxID=50710 RepID=UPI003CFC9E21